MTTTAKRHKGRLRNLLCNVVIRARRSSKMLLCDINKSESNRTLQYDHDKDDDDDIHDNDLDFNVYELLNELSKSPMKIKREEFELSDHDDISVDDDNNDATITKKEEKLVNVEDSITTGEQLDLCPYCYGRDNTSVLFKDLCPPGKSCF